MLEGLVSKGSKFDGADTEQIIYRKLLGNLKSLYYAAGSEYQWGGVDGNVYSAAMQILKLAGNLSPWLKPFSSTMDLKWKICDIISAYQVTLWRCFKRGLKKLLKNIPNLNKY